MGYTAPAAVASGAVISKTTFGDVVIADLNFLANPPACRIYNNADQTINDSTETIITFNSERYDTANLHSTVTNTGRITFSDTGIWRITFRGQLIAGADYAAAYAVIQTSTAVNLDKDERLPTSFNNASFHLSTEYKFVAGDWIVVKMYQDNSANAARAIKGFGQYSPELTARYVGLG